MNVYLKLSLSNNNIISNIIILLSSWQLTPTLWPGMFPRQSLTSGLNMQSVIKLCSFPVQLMLSMSTSGPPSMIRSIKLSCPK